MQRSNMVGVMLGQVTLDDFVDYDPLEDPELAAEGMAMMDMEDASMSVVADEDDDEGGLDFALLQQLDASRHVLADERRRSLAVDDSLIGHVHHHRASSSRAL